MDKVKANVPMLAFVIYFLKASIIGFSSVDVATLLVLGAIYVITENLLEKKELKEIKSELSLLKQEVKEASKKNEELKTHVGGLKLAQQIRPNQIR